MVRSTVVASSYHCRGGRSGSRQGAVDEPIPLGPTTPSQGPMLCAFGSQDGGVLESIPLDSASGAC